MLFIFGVIFALLMPVDTNFDDPALEPTFTMLSLIAITVIVLPSSIAVLKIKHRSMWWMLLSLWYSPLWLSDSKQQCKGTYINAVLAFDTIFLTHGLTYTLEYAQKNPLDTIWSGIIIYIISLILASIANLGFNENNLTLEDLTVLDARTPEMKE